eukprot:8741337-Pyramimonas_sp.AAC.1
MITTGPTTPPAASTPLSASAGRGATRMQLPGGASAAAPVGASPQPSEAMLTPVKAQRSNGALALGLRC